MLWLAAYLYETFVHNEYSKYFNYFNYILRDGAKDHFIFNSDKHHQKILFIFTCN